MEIQELQEKVDKWISQYGVKYFDELTNLALLTEEIGEVARVMARVYGQQSSKSSESELNLADELADVIFVIVCIANQTGINLTEAITKNLQKKTQRDPNRHQQNPKLH